jgi:hypothetical protein
MTLRHAGVAFFAAVALAAACAASCGRAAEVAEAAIAPVVAPGLRWELRLPKEEKVVYRGVVSFDSAGVGTASMLYPAPNIAVGLIAVLVHGLTNEAAKKMQKDKMQDAADQVLSPYQVVLADFNYRDLMQRGVERMATGGTRMIVENARTPGAEWFVESLPVFALTQDQRALVMENALTVYAPGAASAAAWQKTVKVVSFTKSGDDMTAFWTAEDGRNLKVESASLLAESLDIALGEAVSAPAKGSEAYQTFRYPEGGAEKMERGQLVAERCHRRVIRTLRGGLLSVPAGDSAGSCDDAAPGAQ